MTESDNRPIYLSQATVSDREERFIVDALRSGWVAPVGPDIDNFEIEVAKRVGAKYALAVSSGTAALHLILLHLGARPGTVVLCASMTFAATANAIVYCGAEPVFIDSSDDGNLDVDLLLSVADQLRAEGEEVVAAIAVDLFGHCVDYQPLQEGLAQREIPLVCDAAESLGSRYQGRSAGSFGLASAFSFNGNKILTTSGGGMIVTDDRNLIEHTRKLSTQARESDVPWYEHTEIGYNYRLSNILAALGRAQLCRLDDMIDRRRYIRQRYTEVISRINDVRLVSSDTSDHFDNAWLTTIVINRDNFVVDSITQNMKKKGIEVRHLWKPMHRQPVFRSARCFTNGQSDSLFLKGLALPSGAGLTDHDVDRVVSALVCDLMEG